MAHANRDNEANGVLSTNPSSHNILTIPPELFERIAQLSDPNDLTILRRVNKECAASTLRTFKKVHFGKKAFLIASKDSLQCLLDIVRDENFGRALHTLVLCIDVLPHEPGSECGKWLTWAPTSRRDSFKGHQKRKDQGAQYRSYYQKQQSFNMEESDMCLLTTIFSCLKQLGNCIEIIISSRSGSRTKPYFWKELEQETGEHVCPNEWSVGPIGVVLAALRWSALSPSALEIEGYDWPRSLYSLGETQATHRTMTMALTDITRLDLAWSSDDQFAVDEIHDTADVLANAPSLEHLKLYVIRDAHA